jgi:hypothetical protein
MPTEIENALTKITRDFIWDDDSSPRIALETLYRPIEEGGLNLLDIKARNDDKLRFRDGVRRGVRWTDS